MNNLPKTFNEAKISGTVVMPIEFDHELYGEKFYKTVISCIRKSGVADNIPVVISERLPEFAELLSAVNAENEETNEPIVHIQVTGRVGTHTVKHEKDEKPVVEVFIFVKYLHILEDLEDKETCNMNQVKLVGTLNRTPRLRNVPSQRNLTNEDNPRKVANVSLKVPRTFGKHDTIHSVAWGRNAQFLSTKDPGEKFYITGRFQSREKFNRDEEGNIDPSRTTTEYEISINTVEPIEEE